MPPITMHRGEVALNRWKAGLLTFLHPEAPSRPKGQWLASLQGHNEVHSCGTVGDSHSRSQLSTAKCTFTGDSFQNHGAKIDKIIDITTFSTKKMIFCGVKMEDYIITRDF